MAYFVTNCMTIVCPVLNLNEKKCVLFENDVAIVLKSIRYTKVYFWLQFHYKCIQSSNVVVVSNGSR